VTWIWKWPKNYLGSSASQQFLQQWIKVNRPNMDRIFQGQRGDRAGPRPLRFLPTPSPSQENEEEKNVISFESTNSEDEHSSSSSGILQGSLAPSQKESLFLVCFLRKVSEFFVCLTLICRHFDLTSKRSREPWRKNDSIGKGVQKFFNGV
jgi:hypothetical protein